MSTIQHVSENKATALKKKQKNTGNTASENSNTEVSCAKTKSRSLLVEEKKVVREAAWFQKSEPSLPEAMQTMSLLLYIQISGG